MKYFLQTLRGEKTNRVPCWFMRQAGRYLPEYRELRASKGGFLEMAFDPAAACEVTMQPLRRYGMDAAIIFSDILVIPYALGQGLKFAAGEGPVLPPIRDRAGIEALAFDDAKLAPVYEALRLTRQAMQEEGFDDSTALIGFAGAPWTVATYMVEGSGSKDYRHTKEMAFARPDEFQILIDKLVESTSSYLIKQIDAGAEAVQIFDSWAGVLAPSQFQRWCFAPIVEIARRVKDAHPDVPVVAFPRGVGEHYKAFTDVEQIDAIAIDTTIDPKWAAKELQPHKVVQGNLDPMALLAGGETLRAEAEGILDALSDGRFVFNLGHGICKDTDPKHLKELVEIIRNHER